MGEVMRNSTLAVKLPLEPNFNFFRNHPLNLAFLFTTFVNPRISPLGAYLFLIFLDGGLFEGGLYEGGVL